MLHACSHNNSIPTEKATTSANQQKATKVRTEHWYLLSQSPNACTGSRRWGAIATEQGFGGQLCCLKTQNTKKGFSGGKTSHFAIPALPEINILKLLFKCYLIYCSLKIGKVSHVTDGIKTGLRKALLKPWLI